MDKSPPTGKVMERVQSVVKVSRMICARGEELIPIAHIWRGDQVQVVGFPINAPDGESAAQVKDMAREALVKLAEGADLVILVLEAWFYKAESQAEAESSMLRPSEHPDRKECVTLMVETPTRSWTGMAEITGTGKQRGFGEPEWCEKSTGRFTGILRRETLQ